MCGSVILLAALSVGAMAPSVKAACFRARGDEWPRAAFCVRPLHDLLHAGRATSARRRSASPRPTAWTALPWTSAPGSTPTASRAATCHNMDNMFEAAKQLEHGFKLLLTPEYSVQPMDLNVEHMVNRYYDHPNAMRHNGAFCLSSYGMGGGAYDSAAHEAEGRGQEDLLHPALRRRPVRDVRERGERAAALPGAARGRDLALRLRRFALGPDQRQRQPAPRHHPRQQALHGRHRPLLQQRQRPRHAGPARLRRHLGRASSGTTPTGPRSSPGTTTTKTRT